MHRLWAVQVSFHLLAILERVLTVYRVLLYIAAMQALKMFTSGGGGGGSSSQLIGTAMSEAAKCAFLVFFSFREPNWS